MTLEYGDVVLYEWKGLRMGEITPKPAKAKKVRKETKDETIARLQKVVDAVTEALGMNEYRDSFRMLYAKEQSVASAARALVARAERAEVRAHTLQTILDRYLPKQPARDDE